MNVSLIYIIVFHFHFSFMWFPNFPFEFIFWILIYLYFVNLYPITVHLATSFGAWRVTYQRIRTSSLIGQRTPVVLIVNWDSFLFSHFGPRTFKIFVSQFFWFYKNVTLILNMWMSQFLRHIWINMRFGSVNFVCS